eukprot:scaffold84590_cov41-Phaeocystis_antarctica.AAC.2
MLSRMWTAESEKAVTAALIDEYAAAAATAVGPEKAELEDERQGLEITMKGVEDSSAAAQAILYEGGNGDLMTQVMTLTLTLPLPLALTLTLTLPLTLILT